MCYKWEKIFANDVTDKGLPSKIYKQPIQFNNKNQTTQLKNGQKTLTDISPKKTYTWQQAHEKMLNITNYYCWWECKLVQWLWKTVWRCLRKLKSELPYVLAIPLLGQNCNSKRQMHPYLQSTTIHNSQNRETT